jgi:hypothetical protein
VYVSGHHNYPNSIIIGLRPAIYISSTSNNQMECYAIRINLKTIYHYFQTGFVPEINDTSVKYLGI